MMKGNENYKEILNNLNERVKELNCLHEVNRILKDTRKNVNEVFNEVINIIPSGYQYPEICRVQIIYGPQSFQSDDIRYTELKQSAQITIEGEKVGELNIFYIKPVRIINKPIFLPEEQKMLNTIASEISSFLNYSRLKEFMDRRDDVDFVKENTEVTEYLLNMGLTDEDLRHLLKVNLKFKKNEIICKQGAFISYVILITQGLAKAYLEDINDRSYIIKIIKPIGFIGLTSLTGIDHYNFSAKVITESNVYLIEKDILKKIIWNNPKFSLEIMKWYCKNFSLVFHKMSNLSYKQAVGRVADTLLYLHHDIFNEGIIEDIISRKDIAGLSAMSIENAVRILSEFKTDGMIKITREGIEITKPEMLKTISIAG